MTARTQSASWTPEQQAQHRADLLAALTRQDWGQPIPNPLRPARRPRTGQTSTHRKDTP